MEMTAPIKLDMVTEAIIAAQEAKIVELKELLAESQAREAKLRDALVTCGQEAIVKVTGSPALSASPRGLTG